MLQKTKKDEGSSNQATRSKRVEHLPRTQAFVRMMETTTTNSGTVSSQPKPQHPRRTTRLCGCGVSLASSSRISGVLVVVAVIMAGLLLLSEVTEAFATISTTRIPSSPFSSSSSVVVARFVQSTNSDEEDTKSTHLAFVHSTTKDASRLNNHRNGASKQQSSSYVSSWSSALSAIGLGLVLMANVAFLGGGAALAATDGSTYDGFAEYAKDNQMEQSDVQCFVKKCGEQTKNLFSNPRGIKGVSCLGRCKGEQSCATRCFAEFGSENLNNWLSCTIEENECVKVPKNIDNSAENVGYPTALKNFDPKTLVDGSPWYKTDGLNPNYDLFDCQTNTFHASSSLTSNNPNSELDMGIFFRVKRPEESGGGYWENALTEHMIVDAVIQPKSAEANPTGRTMHTSGKMYGLQFAENWYILGESDGSNNIPPFKLVAYKGHTLQGNYEGAFVYAKEPVLPDAAKPAIRDAAMRAGLDFDQFTRIDNTCPVGNSLNDAEAGTGTSTTDWVDLVIGEGGVIDWISPGWRGEYKTKQ